MTSTQEDRTSARTAIGRARRVTVPWGAARVPRAAGTKRSGRRVRREPAAAVGFQYLLLSAAGLMVALPVLWMFLTSVKPNDEVFAYPPQWVPRHPTLSAYHELLDQFPIKTWFRNSLIVALITTAVGVTVSALAAYPLARMQFNGRRLVTGLVLATFLLPFEVLSVPLFLGLARLHLIDSVFSLAVPPAASAFNVFLLVQFYRGLPTELEEAAVVDGATPFRFWFLILIPLSRPALITVAIFSFTTSWNSFFWPLIVSSSDNTRTLPAGIATLVGANNDLTSFSVLVASCVLSALPAIAFFVVFQRYFVKGVATSGLRG